MKFNVSDVISKAEKEYGLGSGEYFKPKEGANKIRLLSECEPHQSHYKGKKTFKFVCWIWDYAQAKVVLFFMPVTILKSIESLQLDPEYAFDEVPMPYDITIMAKNAGTKEVKYTLLPARTITPVPVEASESLKEKKSLAEVVAKLKENEANNPDKQVPVTVEAADDQEIPFG